MRLQQVVKDERRPREFDPREYISTWTEKDLLHGKIVDAWVIIFRTRGCYWARSSGCSMCGYVNDVAQEVSPADIGHQLDVVLKKHQGFFFQAEDGIRDNVCSSDLAPCRCQRTPPRRSRSCRRTPRAAP